MAGRVLAMIMHNPEDNTSWADVQEKILDQDTGLLGALYNGMLRLEIVCVLTILLFQVISGKRASTCDVSRLCALISMCLLW